MASIVEGVATVGDLDAFLDRLGAIGAEHDVAVQAFDARAVVDRAHLERAVELANRAWQRDNAVARDRSVEILLWAAGRRQIDQALALGVSEGEGPVAVVIDADTGTGGSGDGGTDGDGEDERAADRERAAAGSVRDLLDSIEATLGDYDEVRVREFFEITDAELGAVEGDLSDLVRERVALLAVER